MNILEKSILATLAYYHALGRPLTIWEIWRYLIRQPIPSNKSKMDFKQVWETIEKSQSLKKVIRRKNGFFFFKGEKYLAKQRIERQKLADQKWKKALQAIKLIQIIPCIKSIQISGSLAINNSKDNSDIDLLIISQTGRIWTARILLTIFAYLTKQYRHNGLTKNRLCLNHYLTEESLHIPYHSLYNAQTYFNLMPITGKKMAENFQKNNQWIGEYLVNFTRPPKNHLRIIKVNWLFFLRRALRFILDSKIGDILESFLRNFQIKRIKKNPLTRQSGGRIVFNNQQLEFHPNSPEKRVLQKFNHKIAELKLDWPEFLDSGLT